MQRWEGRSGGICAYMLGRIEFWRIRQNNELQQLYDERGILFEIKKERLRMAGHLQRIPEDRIVKKVFQGILGIVKETQEVGSHGENK